MANDRDNAVFGQQVKLQIQYYDANGKKVPADETPTVQIRDYDGNIVLSATDEDVDHLGDGLYQYVYTVPSTGDEGLWTDEWTATIDNAEISTFFSFTVSDTDKLVPTTGPGRVKLGDDVVFDFSDEEIKGINILLKYLKSRLRSSGKKPVRDEFGAFVYDGYGEVVTEDCPVFDDEILVTFLCQALSEFNSVPFFTAYTFSDHITHSLFGHIIVEAAMVFALAAQALVEKGRDFTISDSGISYVPPALGDFLQAHYSTWLTSYRERVKFIKDNIRPGPTGFGSASSLGSSAPAYTRLRHLRSRKVF